MLANTTPIAFTTNKRSEPEIIATSSRAMPIPTTATGGTSATEMATPGSVSESFGFTRAKVAANPDTTAIITEGRDGWVREVISWVIPVI